MNLTKILGMIVGYERKAIPFGIAFE